jgi:RNA polymerase sigma-70 factor (ECF subfamily)
LLSSQEELRLADGAKNGDVVSFGVLSETYRDRITGYFAKRVGNFSDAEDLTQSTFLRAFQKVDTFDPDKGRFGSWVYGIAHNVFVDHVRSGAGARCVVLQDNHAQSDGGINLSDRVISVNVALARFNPEQRRLLRMRFLDHMGYSQIAELLDKNPSTVQSAARRLQKKLSVTCG